MRTMTASTLLIALALGTACGLLVTGLPSSRGEDSDSGVAACDLEQDSDRLSPASARPPSAAENDALDQARRNEKRYREGLERAVAELNRLSRECSSNDSWYPPSRPTLPSADEGERSSRKSRTKSRLRLKGPKLQPFEEDLIAHGSIVNGGDQIEVAEVLLELVHDGDVIDHERLSFYVGAGGEVAFEHTFWAGKLEGTYRVRAKLET